MNQIAFVIGLFAVGFFLLSYLQKRRGRIVVFNLLSRMLYIAQYLLLGAFEGAALDILGAISAWLAQKRGRGFVAKHTKLLFVLINLTILIVGVALYQGPHSLLPMVGILLQAGALWLTKEKQIRLVSMAGCPFWFAYNWISGAYGSCIGDALAFVFLLVSFVRFDLLPRKQSEKKDPSSTEERS